MALAERICDYIHCDNSFTGRSDKRFCCKSCKKRQHYEDNKETHKQYRRDYHRENYIPKVTHRKECLMCGEELTGKRYKFCSVRCGRRFFNGVDGDRASELDRLNTLKKSTCESYKLCGQCLTIFPLSSFWKDSSHKDGLRSNCSNCCIEYYNQNKEVLSEKKKSYVKNNLDKYRIWNGHRRGRINNAIGSYSLEDIEQMFEDQSQLCAYCECNISEGYHVDHMIPLSRGGSNNWDNIALACQSCNLRKYTKTAEEFMEVIYGKYRVAQEKNHSRAAGEAQQGFYTRAIEDTREEAKQRKGSCIDIPSRGVVSPSKSLR